MKNTTAILTEAYPEVEKKIKSNVNKYKQCVSRFINSRTNVLYANAPMEKMYFGENEIIDFFKSTNIDRNIIKTAIEA